MRKLCAYHTLETPFDTRFWPAAAWLLSGFWCHGKIRKYIKNNANSHINQMEIHENPNSNVNLMKIYQNNTNSRVDLMKKSKYNKQQGKSNENTPKYY